MTGHVRLQRTIQVTVYFFQLKEDNSECPHKVTEILTAIFNHKIYKKKFFY